MICEEQLDSRDFNFFITISRNSFHGNKPMQTMTHHPKVNKRKETEVEQIL
jgi:hypothetical protein